jgi:hypothetical protein
MMDYQIQGHTRRCAATGRELRPGEPFFTALLDEGGKFVRRDFSAEAWQGPPEGTFSFWAGKVPVLDESRRPRIDDDLLVDCFQRLEGQTESDRLNFRYVVALLLMRRRRFKFEEAQIDGNREVLYLRCTRTKVQYNVVNPRISEDEIRTVQEEVFKVLGWE